MAGVLTYCLVVGLATVDNPAAALEPAVTTIVPVGGQATELLVAAAATGIPGVQMGFRSDAVTRFDAATGALLGPFVPQGDQGLSRPVGLAAGPDGNLYVAISQGFNAPGSAGAVLRYDGTTRAFIDMFVPPANGLNGAVDVTFGPDGNLYVTSHAANTNPPAASVMRFDGQSGNFIDAFVAPGSGGLVDANTLTFGPDGHLYVASLGSGAECLVATCGSILRYDGTTGAFIDTFVPEGLGGLNNPSGMSFRPDGMLYVVCGDCRPGAVLRYDAASGAFVDVFVQDSALDRLLDHPYDLAFGPDDNLYVSQSFGGFNPASLSAVNRYDGATGAFIDNFALTDSGQLVQPSGILFWPPDPPTELFASFTAAVEIDTRTDDGSSDDASSDDKSDDDSNGGPKGHRFKLKKGMFVLGEDSDGFDLATEDLTLEIGSLSMTILAGVLEPNEKGDKYKFDGVIDGNVRLKFEIERESPGMYQIKADGTVPDLSGVTTASTVRLTIGDDTGEAVVTWKFK